MSLLSRYWMLALAAWKRLSRRGWARKAAAVFNRLAEAGHWATRPTPDAA